MAPVRARTLVWPDGLTIVCAVGMGALAWDAAHRLLAEWRRLQPHLAPDAGPEPEAR